MQSTSGVRGPRAPPESRFPRSVSARIHHGHEPSSSSSPPADMPTSASTSFDTDTDLSVDDTPTPEQIRARRLEAVERRRHERVPSTNGPPAPPIVSPRPLPPLRAAQPLPSLGRPSRPSRPLPQPQFHTRRSSTEPPRPPSPVAPEAPRPPMLPRRSANAAEVASPAMALSTDEGEERLMPVMPRRVERLDSMRGRSAAFRRSSAAQAALAAVEHEEQGRPPPSAHASESPRDPVQEEDVFSQWQTSGEAAASHAPRATPPAASDDAQRAARRPVASDDAQRATSPTALDDAQHEAAATSTGISAWSALAQMLTPAMPVASMNLWPRSTASAATNEAASRDHASETHAAPHATPPPDVAPASRLPADREEAAPSRAASPSASDAAAPDPAMPRRRASSADDGRSLSPTTPVDTADARAVPPHEEAVAPEPDAAAPAPAAAQDERGAHASEGARATDHAAETSDAEEADGAPTAQEAAGPAAASTLADDGALDERGAAGAHEADTAPGPAPSTARAAAEQTLTRPAPAAAAAPVPALAPLDAATRTRRRESRHGVPNNRRRPTPSTLLAALTTQAVTGPGVLLPSLYGSLADEPAPTSLRPAAVAYHGRGAGQHGEHGAPLPSALVERILASGPSVSNLHPAAVSNVVMSPGVERSVAAALLRSVHVQPGSVALPAGTLSGLGPAEGRDVQLSRKFEENGIVSFSWRLDDVALLQREVDFGSKAESGGRRSEAWNWQPLFGHERWRLEFSRRPQPTSALGSPRASRRASGPQPHVLSLALSFLGLTALPFKAELPTHVMLGLRPAPHHDPAGHAADFVWQDFFSHTFQQEQDTLVYSTFPRLTTLVPDDLETHALELVVQIATGPSALPEENVSGPQGHAPMHLPFAAPGMVSVPRGLRAALGALVDDASTGDLMIIVCEKGIEQAPNAELAESVGLARFIKPWPTGQPMPAGLDEPAVYVRDRVLWAHTSILRERSDIFATMVESQFTEGVLYDTPAHGSAGRARDPWRRPYRMLRVPGADYVTMYWFLRYLYTEQVEWLADDDVQAVSLDDHWILDRDAGPAKPDWKWRLVDEYEDMDGDGVWPMHEAQTPRLFEGRGAPPGPRASEHGVEGRRPSDKSAADPHPHPPMLAVPPASALALYRLAHRYHVLDLCDLATAQIVSRLTPDNATNYLLCTAVFSQLQHAIQNYICTW